MDNGKHLIQMDCVMNNNGDYEICFFQDMNGLKGYELIQEQQKFITKAVKGLQTIGTSIILDILSDFDIKVEQKNNKAYFVALNSLKEKYGKTIEIQTLKQDNDKVVSVENGDMKVYMTKDNFIYLSERIALCQEKGTII